MNDSASEEASEFSNEDSNLSEPDTLDGADDADEASPARATREGLPASFRMRHDAHYVDELMSADARAHRADRRPLTSPPGIETRADTAASLALLANRLEALVEHARAIRPHAGSMPLIADAVQVELARAARLARAAALLPSADAPLPCSIPARSLADAIGVASAPSARLGGVDCDVAVDDAAFAIVADDVLLVQAVAGTVDALVELLTADPRRRPACDGRAAAPRVSIALQSVKVRPAVIIDVVCPALAVSEFRARRLFENRAEDFSLLPAAGILLAAAAKILRLHGGRADVKRHNGVGVTVSYMFPQTVADASAEY